MFSEPDDSDEEPGVERFLPKGVTPEQAQSLVTEVVEQIEKLGLYCKHAHLAVMDEEDTPRLGIHAIFTFGKVAFLPRIQNPEQDKFDDEFRRFETDEAASIREDVLGDFLRKPGKSPES